MRAVFLLVLLVMLALPAPTQSQEGGKGWRGLVPLRATRHDVEGLLGSPTESVYQTDNERVRFDYSDGPCEKGWPYGWNVKPDTVVSILVKPNDTLFLSELKLDYKKYVKRDIPNHTRDRYYIDEDEGVAIQVEPHQVEPYSEKVMWFIYMPTKADSKLACPDSLNRLPVGRHAADSLYKFDVYGDISTEAEQERLDNVALKMNSVPDTEVSIIAYGGMVTHAGEAAARATCARNYLIKKHRINPDRIKAIDGGYQEIMLVELYVEPKDGEVPLARPSVRPSKVKIDRARQPLPCKLTNSPN